MAILVGAAGGALATSAHAAPAAQARNPLAKLSADQIAKEAITDLDSASSFRIYQSAKVKGQTLSITLSITHKGCTGTFKLGNMGAFAVVEISSTIYIQPNNQMWKSLGIPAGQLSQVSGKWIKGSSTGKDSLGTFCAINKFASSFGLQDTGLTKGRTATVAHHEALQLEGKNGMPSYYVTVSSKPEFLTANSAKAGPYSFSAYNARVRIAAPPASEILSNPPGGTGADSVFDLARGLS